MNEKSAKTPPDGKFDLNLVRVFVAIYEARSVTLAAERLELTQPTVSHALSKLRQVYGDRLFERGAAGLRPTQLAEQLFESFGRALAAINATLEQRHGFDPKSSTRRFCLAMSDIGLLYFGPLLLRRFQQSAPNIQTDIVEVSNSVSDDLALGKIDLAIGNLPELAIRSRNAVLFRERYVCLLSANHPTIGERMTRDDFVKARHIMVSSRSLGHRTIETALEQMGVTRNIVARVPQFTVLPALLTHSDFVVMLPSRVANLYLAQHGLKALELPFAIAEFDVRVHWHPRQEGTPALTWLLDEVIGTLSSL